MNAQQERLQTFGRIFGFVVAPFFYVTFVAGFTLINLSTTIARKKWLLAFALMEVVLLITLLILPLLTNDPRVFYYSLLIMSVWNIIIYGVALYRIWKIRRLLEDL